MSKFIEKNLIWPKVKDNIVDFGGKCKTYPDSL